jgi:RNA polymerase sigma factor (sigma-70 family)
VPEDIRDIKLAIKGNKDAFVRLIKSMETSMYRVASSILGSDADCADAIQETILKAYRSMKSLKEPAYFKTWLIRILINESNRILKYRSRVIPMEKLRESVMEEELSGKMEIKQLIEALDDELQLVVTLYYFEDLPLKEISALMGIPEGTCKSRLHRARERLATLLQMPHKRSDFN